MKALKAIKRIVAAGVGLAFVGATIGSAMALDLGDYPAPFATTGGYNGKIVVGANAKAIDIIGAVNIAASFTNVGGSGNVIVETPEGKVVDAVAFDQKDGAGSDVDDMPMKGETRILDFDPDDSVWSFMQGYNNDDINEELAIYITAGVGDSECDPDEVVKINNFTYTFTDESSALSDALDDVRDDDDFLAGKPVKFEYDLTLFGKQYKVVNEKVNDTNGNDTLDADEINTQDLKLQLAYADHEVQAGDEIDLSQYGYPGYTLKIVRITEESSGGGADDGKVKVELDKNGVKVDDDIMDEPPEGEETTVRLKDADSDVEVKVILTDVYYDATSSQYYAEIRFETGILKVGDYFDDNHEWKLSDLSIDPANDKLTIKVTYNEPKNDEDCKLEGMNLYNGNTLNMLGYVELGFVGLSKPSTGDVKFDVHRNANDELELTIIPDDNVYVKTAHFKGKGTKATFVLDTGSDASDPSDDSWNLTSFEGKDSDKVKESGDHLQDVELYIDSDHKYVVSYNATGKKLQITEPSDLVTDTIEIDNFIDTDWADNVFSDEGVLKVGDKTNLGTELVDYSHYDRNAEFKIVSDAVRYLVYAGHKVKYTGNEVTLKVGDNTVTGKIKAVGAKPLPVGLAILDSELSSPDAVKSDNYIVVGGPCVNSAAAALMGVTAENCAEGFTPGEALIKLYENDDHYQLLVAGYNGEDTLLATKVLGSYKDFADKFKGKTEVKVTGTTLSDVEIQG